MCGFSGITKKNKDFVKYSQNLLSSRSYDGNGIYVSNEISIHHAHLKISDLDKDTSQPFINDEVIVGLVGEIYNKAYLLSLCGILESEISLYTEIHTISLLYKKFGKHFIQYLNGEFSLYINDRKTNTHFLYRDRYGTHALYYKVKDTILSFSSELKVLLEEKNESQMDGFYDSLIFGFTISPHTLFADIYSIYPSQFLEFQEGKYIIHDFLPYQFQDSTVSFLETLEQAVIRRIPLFQNRIFFPLSGGADSNLILYFLKKHFSGEIISYSYLSSSNQEDIDVAVKNAQRHKVSHTIIEIEKYAHENASEVHESLTSLLDIGKILRENIPHSHDIRVEFSGDGREELLLANSHFQIDRIQKNYEYLKSRYTQSNFNIDNKFLNLSMFDFNLQLLEKVTLNSGIERRIPFTDYEMLRFAGKKEIYTIESRKFLIERGFEIVSQTFGHNNGIGFQYPKGIEVLKKFKVLKDKLIEKREGKY